MKPTLLSERSLSCLPRLRLALCVSAMLFVVGCEAPAKKLAPEADTGASADTAVDTGIADTGDTTGGGDAIEDTAPDAADTAPDTLDDTSEPPATCDEQLGLLPSTDCGCGGQLVCRDQTSAPECVGALPENACGGCGGIAVEIGAGCGFCGDGVWTCDPANPDQPTCVGETPQNSCGGCTLLPGMEGDSCSADGFFLCVNEEELACVGPGQNACGGFGTLGDALGGPCGECGAGRFVCDGTDAVRCEEAASPRNACGGCGTLPNRVGDDCGDCGGTWACDPGNEDGLVCSQTRNVCGSCGSPGSGALGEACTGGRLVCGADGQLSCESNDRNLCGGTAELSAEPGTDCGTCGGVSICAGLDRVVCIGSSPLNACGGCGFLPGFPGTFCGVDHTWECAADGSMACVRTTSSVVVSDTVGATTAVEDGQVSVPPGAVTEPIRITIRVRNGMMIPGYELTSPVLEFGPAGTEFAQPLEVQIISDDAPASDMVWSNRASEGGGYSEVAGATVDGDALVGDVSHFSLGFTGIPIPDTELCGDGLDNDGDALADCDDTDCAAVPGCSATAPEDCANGADDDADLFVDCDDSDCLGEPECGEVPVEVCGNGMDDDVDGMTDCADADCADDANCSGCATFFCPVRGQVCGIGPEGPVCYTPCAGDADCAAGEVCTALGCAPDTGADAGFDGGGDADAGDAGGGGEGGLCLNSSDQFIFGTTDLDAATLTCGLACVSDVDPAACAAACVEAETGLSPGCAGCQGTQTACLITNCLSFCSADPAGALCEFCNINFCQAEYARCSGAGGPESNCNDGLDNNLNGSADCSDPICAVDRTCTFGCAELGCPSGQECVSNACIPATRELDCGDGLDDDGDGFLDCLDGDCNVDSGCNAIDSGSACGGESDLNLLYAGNFVASFACRPRATFEEPGVLDCVVEQSGFSPACSQCVADFMICDASTSSGVTCVQSLRTCSGIPFIVGEVCGNGVDDDGNRLVDCDDAPCGEAPECRAGAVAEECADSVDNDTDGRTDCLDLDCAVACALEPEDCGNRQDDNANGVFDCYEPSCAADVACTVENCGNAIDDNGNGQTDCADAQCTAAAGCVEGLCGDGLDGDTDGATDCDDSDCLIRLYEDANDGTLPEDWTTSAATSSTAGWALTTDGALDGLSLRSGVIPNYGTSDLTIPSPTRGAGRLSFWWKTETESGYDILSLLFGTSINESSRSGIGGWEQVSVEVPAGTASVTFRYSKDGSGTRGADAVWVDNIEWVSGEVICLPEICGNGVDDNLDAAVDCEDSDCATAFGCVETACNDYLDDDDDGSIDCLDADCAGSAECQEICDDGIDNDGDGLPDCYDVACRGSAACPAQSCLGVAFPGAVAPYNGFGYGYTPTGCAPGEGCSLRVPGEPYTYAAWAGQQLYAGVCAPERTTGESCGVGTTAGLCGDNGRGAGCLGSRCQGNEVPSYYAEYGYCGTGETALSALGTDGAFHHYCASLTLSAAGGEACGDTIGKYCIGDAACLNPTTLLPTRTAGVCIATATNPASCAAGTIWRSEYTSAGARRGLCIPLGSDGEACSSATLCDASAGLVCGSGGTCRPVVVGEACAAATTLEANSSGIGPDYFAVGRLDGGTAADESLNCSGTVGPEKVYFYTATSPVELDIQVGSVDGNGPLLSWYARKQDCSDIFAEASCASASALPTSGKLQLQTGETAYLVVDSEARWAGGDAAAGEFFLAVTERPLAAEGGSCAAAACADGLNCTSAEICASPVCGDGVLDVDESCDDGNAVNADGCTACSPDVFGEVEDNNSLGTANQIGAARRVSGTAYYDTDFFCFNLGPYGGRVTVRNVPVGGDCDLIFDGSWLGCDQERTFRFNDAQGCISVYEYDTEPYLFDVKVEPFAELTEGEVCGLSYVTGAVCADIGGVPAVCRENSPRVHAGTCERSTCGDGYVDSERNEACDDGNTTAADGCSPICQQEAYNEIEPNNGTLTARNIGGYRQVSGTISTASDYDYFKITLAKRSHLELTVTSASFAPYNRGLGVQVLNASSAVLFGDSLDPYYAFSGARSGSREGSGYLYRAEQLAFLEPGTYTLRVAPTGSETGGYVLGIRAIPTSVAPLGAACDPLTYKTCLDGLQCSLSTRTCATPVCGDGNNTVDEGCDDGNTTPGDGCDASCGVESYALELISTDSRTPTALGSAGTTYPFPDGSSARAVALTNGSGSVRFVSVNLSQPTRIRGYNLVEVSIWQTGVGSDITPSGLQVANPNSYEQVLVPNWLGAVLPTPAVDSWDCDGASADGVCADATGGTDCMDCGARFGVDPGSRYGFDFYLPAGTFTLRLYKYDGGVPTWLVLGDSPSERRR